MPTRDARRERRFTPGRDSPGLEKRELLSITVENPAGQMPQGSGANNGQAIEAVNPAGHAPPGQNA
jgi:hypothetical protein